MYLWFIQVASEPMLEQVPADEDEEKEKEKYWLVLTGFITKPSEAEKTKDIFLNVYTLLEYVQCMCSSERTLCNLADTRNTVTDSG